jgi:hypothetical protein
MPLPDNDLAYNPLHPSRRLSDEQRRERAAAWHVGTGDLNDIDDNYGHMAHSMWRHIIKRDINRALTHHEERTWQRVFSTFYAFAFGAAWLVAHVLTAKDEQNYTDAREPEKLDIARYVLLFTAIRMLPALVNYFYTIRLKDLPDEYLWPMDFFEDEHQDSILMQRFNGLQQLEELAIRDYKKYMYTKLFPAGAFLIHVTKVLLSDRDSLSRPIEYGYQMQFICTAGHMLLDYLTSLHYGRHNNTPAMVLAKESDSIAKQLFEASKSVQHINCALMRVQSGSLTANVIEINISSTSAAIGGIQRYQEIYNHVNEVLGSGSELNWLVVANQRQPSYPFSILVSPFPNDNNLVTRQIDRLVSELQTILGVSNRSPEPGNTVSRPMLMMHYAPQRRNQETNEQAEHPVAGANLGL